MHTRGKENNGNTGLGVPLRVELLSRLGRDREEVGVDGGLVDKIDQFLIRLCAILGTGRGIIDEPLDDLVCRVVRRAIRRDEERDGSNRSLLLK